MRFAAENTSIPLQLHLHLFPCASLDIEADSHYNPASLTLLSGSYLPGKKSSFAHFLLLNEATLCHATTKVGVLVLISTFF